MEYALLFGYQIDEVVGPFPTIAGRGSGNGRLGFVGGFGRLLNDIVKSDSRPCRMRDADFGMGKKRPK